MLKELKECYQLYFLNMESIGKANTIRITEDTILNDKLILNPYRSEVYLQLKLKKNYQSNKLFDNYNKEDIRLLDMLFYNDIIFTKQMMILKEIISFTNKGSYYEIVLKVNENWADKLLNEYMLPHEHGCYKSDIAS